VIFFFSLKVNKVQNKVQLTVKLDDSKSTKKIMHHGSDCTSVLSTAPAQKSCRPY
jgi:hypothetical protein